MNNFNNTYSMVFYGKLYNKPEAHKKIHDKTTTIIFVLLFYLRSKTKTRTKKLKDKIVKFSQSIKTKFFSFSFIKFYYF